MKRWAFAAAAAMASLFAAGCVSFQRSAPRPGLTYVGSHPVTLAARLLGNVLIVETKGDENGPYHFVIDTGSSVTLVSPYLAKQLKMSELMPASLPKVRVRSSEGGTALLDTVTLRKLQLGSARFEYVPALVYDCADVSDQFGVRIDGILGFPLFRNAVLTLDYPHERVVLRSQIPTEGLPGETILFDNAQKTPLVPIRIGDHELEALIDSGSSASIDVNPAGLSPKFTYGPVDGPTVSTLAGDRPSKVGRLSDVVRIGSFDIPQPVAELTDELSSLGGGILSHFTVTFDQEHNEVFFQHEPADSMATPALRGTGLSFRKTPAYWKVAGVVAGSPADTEGVRAGDLISRINGEPVANWDLPRYEALVAAADRIDFTFINGAQSTVRPVAVIVLVP
jgi:Aspartyl protease/PDZ domain